MAAATKRFAGLVFVLAWSWALAVPALAQGAGQDAAAAQVLWEEGRDHAQKGDFEKACPKFAESQRLDPQLGTLLNLGDCYARIGKVASAWARFVEAAELAEQRSDPREAEARRRADELEPKLSKLQVRIEKEVDGLVVERDGEAMSEAQWGMALPIDPGEHRIKALAPGRKSWETSVLVEEAMVAEVSVPPLERAMDGGIDVSPEPLRNAPQLVAGAIVGALGLAGLGVGTAFFVIAKNKDNQSLEFCPTDPTICEPEGIALRDQAREAQTIAIVSTVGGGVLTVTGALLVITAMLSGEDDDVDEARGSASHVGFFPTLSVDGGGLVLAGRF